jgi:hypothetical protein
MSSLLISRSADLKRLRDDGYEISIKAGHLLMANVPYVNASKEVKRGVLVTDLTLAGDVTAPPASHVVWFVGEQPCHKDGREIAQIKHDVSKKDLGGGLVADRSFSNKPPGGYPDYYEKMTRYATIIANEAAAIEPAATPRTFAAIPSESDESSVFHYIDTASSRAGIVATASKLSGLKVGIIGLGGTGAYVLDLVAKCPVDEIHLWDGDVFLQHNAFRAPGAPSLDELKKRPSKVARLAEMYSRMHRGIAPHERHIDAESVGNLRGLDFVFICIDKNEPKRVIVESLEALGTRFVDVGMGVLLVDEHLIGILRVTTSTPAMREHVRGKHRVPFAANDGDDDYSRNIQIAELNAMTAALAVIKWKKLYGFYQDLEHEHHTTYTINVNMMTGEDIP